MIRKLLTAAILVSAPLLAADVLGVDGGGVHAGGATADPDGWSTIAALDFPVDTPVAFKESRKTRLQRTAKAQSGTLWLDASGSFVMSVTQPRAEKRQLNNTTLSLERRGKTRSTTLDPERGAHQLLLSIVSVLQGDVRALKQNFSLQVDKVNSAHTPEQDWSLSLIPSKEKLNKELTQLTLKGRANQLVSIRAERGKSFQQIEILNSAKDTSSEDPTL